jgi:transposase-like protein
MTITRVASMHGMTPQALRTWVRQAERDLLRAEE